MTEWISVKERLPERDGKFLCWYGFEHDGVRSNMMFMGCLDYFAHDAEPHFQHASAGLYVTHWFHLPEPPKEDANET